MKKPAWCGFFSVCMEKANSIFMRPFGVADFYRAIEFDFIFVAQFETGSIALCLGLTGFCDGL